MRQVSHTVIHPVPAPIERVFAVLTDPARIAQWLPGCGGVESPVPLRKGVRFKARFGNRETEFEVVDFAPPTAFGLVERGERDGWKTLFRLDETAGSSPTRSIISSTRAAMRFLSHLSRPGTTEMFCATV